MRSPRERRWTQRERHALGPRGLKRRLTVCTDDRAKPRRERAWNAIKRSIDLGAFVVRNLGLAEAEELGEELRYASRDCLRGHHREQEAIDPSEKAAHTETLPSSWPAAKRSVT